VEEKERERERERERRRGRRCNATLLYGEEESVK
jgi:hypothetical protein